MKRLLFTVILSFSLLNISAQDSAIHLPDSLGKYLYELFINKADISKSELEVLDSDYFSPGDSWRELLGKTNEYGFNTENTEYYNTYFNLRRHQGIFYANDLRILMKQEAKIYAFNMEVYWIENHWIIGRVDTDLYGYSIADGSKNLTYDVTIPDNFKPNYTENFEPTVDIAQPETLFLPDLFAKKVLELLSNESPFGNNEIFLTKQEYLSTEGARYIKLIDKWLEREIDMKEEKEKVMSVYNDPGILYEELMRHWNMLPGSLKEEFGNNIKDLEIKDIQLDISNWDDKEGIPDEPRISATISMPLHYEGKDAGIYFSAIWYNGMWKLSYIQGFAYGISSAESAAPEYMENETAVEVE